MFKLFLLFLFLFYGSAKFYGARCLMFKTCPRPNSRLWKWED